MKKQHGTSFATSRHGSPGSNSGFPRKTRTFIARRLTSLGRMLAAIAEKVAPPIADDSETDDSET